MDDNPITKSKRGGKGNNKKSGADNDKKSDSSVTHVVVPAERKDTRTPDELHEYLQIPTQDDRRIRYLPEPRKVLLTLPRMTNQSIPCKIYWHAHVCGTCWLVSLLSSSMLSHAHYLFSHLSCAFQLIFARKTSNKNINEKFIGQGVGQYASIHYFCYHKQSLFLHYIIRISGSLWLTLFTHSVFKEARSSTWILFCRFSPTLINLW